jgi:hypothetical protein
LLALLAALSGCERSKPSEPADAEQPADPTAAPASTQPASQPAEVSPPPPPLAKADDPPESDVLALVPQVAPPPPALPPALPSGVSPTRYADARIGQRTVMEQQIGETRTRRITEVRRVTADDVHVRQTVEYNGQAWHNDMTFHRYVSTPQAEPGLGGKIVGREKIEVGGKVLTCDVREGEQGGERFRIYTCPDVLGWVVRQETQQAGQWAPVLELVDFDG